MCKLAVIDDNPLEHFIIQKILSNYGLFPDRIHLSDARQLLPLLGNSLTDFSMLPDVIFLDLNMPEFSGWDFLKQLSSIYDLINKPLDVFILSSSINDEDLVRSRSYPFVKDFLNKPVQIETLKNLHSSYMAA